LWLISLMLIRGATSDTFITTNWNSVGLLTHTKA
jgi:hypothetical protein